MSKIHFISLGCPKNLVDSEVMLASLIQEGHELTDDPAKAGVIIVNTCAFVEDAKKEAIDTILEMAEHKKKGTCKRLIVTGCLPERYESEIAKLLPEVDVFLGAGDIPKIAEVVGKASKGQVVDVSGAEYLYDHTTPRFQTTPKHIAYIKIAEGCFHPCSFCIIPELRGKFRSRDIASVVAEAEALLANGVRELVLVAQDSTAFGRSEEVGLAKLLERLALLHPRKWVRVMYAYPHGFPRDVIAMMNDYADVCRYLDIPIQHINDRILKAMGREGGGREIRGLIGRLRTDVPGISLRTSVIAGFPGETQKEFDELLDFISEARFEHLGAFTFSPEEGTRAGRLKKRVPSKVAKLRKNELMDIQRKISLGNNMKKVGRTIEVLVDGPSPESELLLQARHEGQAPDIDGVVYINEGSARAGEFAQVKVTEAHDYDLVARVV